MRRLILLGSTGSIGCSTLDVATAMPDEVRVVALAAGGRWELLAEQVARFRVPVVALNEEKHYDDLRRACPGGTQVLAGPNALVELVQSVDADLVLAAVVGAAGLPATLAAVERGMDLALANKESLVVAGELLMPLARERKANVIPVDSEHSAVFQAMQAGQRAEVSRVYLTASGGPFRAWERARIRAATLEQALRHPTWSMGPKITIDSASMMNKGLEVIEAHHLFGLPPEQIEVLVHPESIVHSIVEFCDGSQIAQLGTPDMKTPIQYAVTYPRRVGATAQRLAWSQARNLTFEPPDFERFPNLALAFEAARRGGTAGAVLNAANEAAVELFRAARITFGQMMDLTGSVFGRQRVIPNASLEQLLAADAWAREEVRACCPR